MPIKPYFKRDPETPPPLSVTVTQRVRFEECDPLGIVWHGRYTSYFEDARVASGEKFGIGYMTFYNQGVSTPLKQMRHDYIKPMMFNDTFTTEALLHWSEAARLNYEFIIRDKNQERVATGYTVQLMLERDFTVMLTPPPFYLEFMNDWRKGKFNV
jgi:acyl-CoA thioester hydrolase